MSSSSEGGEGSRRATSLAHWSFSTCASSSSSLSSSLNWALELDDVTIVRYTEEEEDDDDLALRASNLAEISS